MRETNRVYRDAHIRNAVDERKTASHLRRMSAMEMVVEKQQKLRGEIAQNKAILEEELVQVVITEHKNQLERRKMYE